MPLVQECERLGVTALLVPRLFEAVGWRSRHRQVGPVTLNELRPVCPDDLRFAVKYCGRLVAALSLVVLAPLMLMLAACVKASSPGPVLFRQRRVGRDGREFTMLKFRTMRDTAAGTLVFVPAQGCAPGGVEHEDRRTRVGMWLRRASLDELPQLLNVLRGEIA